MHFETLKVLWNKPIYREPHHYLYLKSDLCNFLVEAVRHTDLQNPFPEPFNYLNNLRRKSLHKRFLHGNCSQHGMCNFKNIQNLNVFQKNGIAAPLN